MQLMTIENVPGKTAVRVLGVVTGSTIRAKHIGKDIMAGLKSIVGGELKGYSEMMLEAREQAKERMIAAAEELGANAIIGMRFSTSDIMGAAAEVLCYGTAVVV